jgi:hypothetical protein
MDQDKFYQRLFSLGYPINSFRLRVVSDGETPISFDDISYYNVERFGKIEVKIPGNDSKSTEWLDVTKLYSSGCYEDGDGALYGEYAGATGDFTVPVTFGYRNNADSGNMIAVRITYFGTNAGEVTESKKRIITMLEVLPSE